MPVPSPTGQPDGTRAWFAGAEALAILDSERTTVERALAERPGMPWLWLAPAGRPAMPDQRGLALAVDGRGWSGAIACSLPLPLPNESLGTVVLQHVAGGGDRAAALLAESARVLVPGGRLWLFALNPLSPYPWRWRGLGLRAAEPVTWRRRLRAVGLQPDPVSQGLGPAWRVQPAGQPQDGPGLRAAYAIRAEKRTLPLTPLRGQAMRVPREAAVG